MLGCCGSRRRIGHKMDRKGRLERCGGENEERKAGEKGIGREG